MDIDGAIGQLTAAELRAVDEAVAVIQAECSYCISAVTPLLRSLAMDLLITGQVLSRCRGLPEEDSTKEGCISVMTRKQQETLAMFHERSRSICRLCQAATRRCVEVWRMAKSM